MVEVFVFAVLWRSLLLPVFAQEQNWPEYVVVSPARPELIQLAAGKEVRLHCGPKAKHTNQGRARIHWTYKRCGFSYNSTNCDKVAHEKWQTVTCKPRTCNTRLILTNTTENDSGLYRCMDRSHVHKSYQLDVVDKTGPPPQLIDKLPTNMTVLETNPAVMMCRVVSKQPPSILWFRRQDGYSRDINNYIQYLEDSYELLNDSSTVALTDELYLSKYIIQHTAEKHSGYYVCLAINAQGYSHRGAYLNISPFRNEDYRGMENYDSSSLSILFLIPVALALVPTVTGLLCWLWCKRCDKNPVPLNNNRPDMVDCRYAPVTAAHAVPHAVRRGEVV